MNSCTRTTKSEYYAKRFNNAVDSRRTLCIKEIGMGRTDIGSHQLDVEEINRDFVNLSRPPVDNSIYRLSNLGPNDIDAGNFQLSL